MPNYIKLLGLGVLLMVSGCAGKTYKNAPVTPVIRSVSDPFPNDQSVIVLQNVDNRAIARCSDNGSHTAENCARYFEQNGYVRLRDIPYKTANYDFLKVDTYPTRRWRDSEITSRW